jgi:hypothetical protein
MFSSWKGSPTRTAIIDHIPQSMLELALSLANFAVGPPIPSLPCTPYDNIRDFVWIRKDVCLRITTHLDDEDNLKASIGDLVHCINTTPDKDGTVYGITSSIFHCAIVRVDKDELGTSFTHIPTLQFLPSFFFLREDDVYAGYRSSVKVMSYRFGSWNMSIGYGVTANITASQGFQSSTR